MRLLLAITICSFCAALWVTLSVSLSLARRIRLDQMLRARTSRHALSQSTQEFFEAGEFRTPRALRLKQDIRRAIPGRYNRSSLDVRLREGELGDLSDPYATPLRGIGIQQPVLKCR